MSNRVAQFLIDLSKDPAAMETFAKDPGLLLSGAGLTEAEEEMVRSADTDTIYRSLAGGEHAALLVIGSMKPPPPPPPPPPEPSEPPPGPQPSKGQAGVF